MTETIPKWAIQTEADEEALKQGCFWDQKQADRILKFTYKFFTSQYIKGKIKLCPEQEQFLQRIYGWRNKDNSIRHRVVNLHVPKKSFAKTLLACIVCYYELLGAGVQSANVISCAAAHQNAGQVYDELKYSLSKSVLNVSESKKLYTWQDQQKRLSIPQLNAKFQSIANSGNKNHGTNASHVSIDEAAWIKSPELYESMRFATVARENGFILIISTASDNQDSWYHQRIYKKSKAVIDGTDLDITHLGVVYEMDQDIEANPEDEKQWIKANPLLGNKWCPIERFRDDLNTAKAAGIGEWINFQRLRLGKWCKSSELAYFDVTNFDNGIAKFTDEELKQYKCYCGVDLSETGDPSSVSITWDLCNGTYYTKSKSWVTEKAAKGRDAANAKRYEEYESLEITAGDLLDERKVLDYLIEMNNKYNFTGCNFDPRSAYIMSKRFEEEGVECNWMPPSAKFFNPAMTELRKLLNEDKLLHNGDQWLKFCLMNVRVEVNRFGEVYPTKSKSIDKIDCCIALCLSFYGLIANQQQQSEIVWS